MNGFYIARRDESYVGVSNCSFTAGLPKQIAAARKAGAEIEAVPRG